MLQPIFLVVLRLFGLTLAGYLLFSIPLLRRRLLDPFVFVVLNVLFPLYFVHNFPAGWDAAVAVGWQWMVVFFAACIVLMGFQMMLGRFLVHRTRLLQTEHPRELVSLFAVHNAGYLPLPILSVFAPQSLMVYMFFFVLAFNLIFWTVAVSYMSGRGRLVFRLNVPIVGIFVGLLLAVFHLYRFVPSIIRLPIKLLIFPALFMIAMIFVPLRGLPPGLAFGIRLGVVLQAAVPPATNLMIVAKAFGTEKQVHYTGSGIIVTYLSSLVTLPLFLFLSTLLY